MIGKSVSISGLTKIIGLYQQIKILFETLGGDLCWHTDNHFSTAIFPRSYRDRR